MTIQERGDALLTAYVNKDFETVKELWAETARNAEVDGGRDLHGRPRKIIDDVGPVVALHGYSNPSITDTRVGDAIVEAVNATRDYEAEAREEK